MDPSVSTSTGAQQQQPEENIVVSSQQQQHQHRTRAATTIKFAKKLIRFKNTFASESTDTSLQSYVPSSRKKTVLDQQIQDYSSDDISSASPLTSTTVATIPEYKFTENQSTMILFHSLLVYKANLKFKHFVKRHPDNKQQRLRAAAVKELYDTELSYLSGLELCYKEYFLPIGKILATEEEVLQIFSNMEQILQLNKQLFGDIQKELISQYLSLDESNENDTIVEIDNLLWCRGNFGKVFDHFAPFFKIYTTFVNDFDSSNNKLTELIETNPKFAAHLETTSDRVGKTLDSLLITIIQRIPRYSLIFKELLLRTDPEHTDYKHLQSALTKINEQASFVNEMKRQFENDLFYIKLQMLLSHKSNLVQPGRSYLRQGQMKVTCPRKDLDHMCTLYLCNDILVIVPIGSEDLIRKVSQIIFFSFCKLKVTPSVFETLPVDGDPSFQIETFHAASIHTLKFIPNSMFEAKEWVTLIDENMVETKRKVEKKTDPRKLESLLEETSVSMNKSDKEFELTKLESRRVNLWNRVNVGEKKIHTSNREHESKKSSIAMIEHGLRIAREEKMKLEKLIESDSMTLELFKKDLSTIDNTLSQLNTKYDADTKALRNVDSYLVKTVFNGDVDGFVEVFDRDPTCELNESEQQALKSRRASQRRSMRFPLDTSNGKSGSPSSERGIPPSIPKLAIRNPIAPAISNAAREVSKVMSERSPQRALLNYSAPQSGPMRMPALPTHSQHHSASTSPPTSYSQNSPRNSPRGNNSPPQLLDALHPMRKHLSQPLLHQNPKNILKNLPSTNSLRVNRPEDSLTARLAQQNTYAKIKKSRRVQVRTQSTILRDDPYFKFVQNRLKESISCTLDTKVTDFDTISVNPLYCLKPVDSWTIIPGDVLIYKYSGDRANYGEKTTYFTDSRKNDGYNEIIDNRDKQSMDSVISDFGTQIDAYIDGNDYDPLSWTDDELPNDPAVLKDMIAKLQSSALAWKNRYNENKNELSKSE
jgi:hypothetical protein